MINCKSSDTIRIESLGEARAVTTVGFNWLKAYDLWKRDGDAVSEPTPDEESRYEQWSRQACSEIAALRRDERRHWRNSPT